MITAKPGMCMVEMTDATRTFGANGNQTCAVRAVSLQVLQGELLLLLGPSGSGKTTLLTMIGGLLKPTSGTVSLFGKEIDRYTARELQQIRATRIGFVFQTFHLIDSLTVLENVTLVLRFAGRQAAQAERQAETLLERLHIGHLANKFPATLSQGEKQRAAVARATANAPDLIIADEPTASLETRQGLDIIRLLREYAKEENRSVIVASHDLRIVEFADRALRIEDGILTSMNVAVQAQPPSRSLYAGAG